MGRGRARPNHTWTICKGYTIRNAQARVGSTSRDLEGTTLRTKTTRNHAGVVRHPGRNHGVGVTGIGPASGHRTVERYWLKLGMAMATKIPMIATTIMSSINVKPF